MPDPLSRAVSSSVFQWDASVPSIVTHAVSDMAQYGIFLAVLVVGLGALWAAGGSPRDRVVRTVLRLLPGILAVGIALVAAHFIGQVLPEARPFVALGQQPLFPHAADASFPSDHVSGGMAMLAARVGRGTKALTVVIVALVGAARVLAGVHWVDDIVGAAIIGLAIGWLISTAWSGVFAGRLRARTA